MRLLRVLACVPWFASAGASACSSNQPAVAGAAGAAGSASGSAGLAGSASGMSSAGVSASVGGVDGGASAGSAGAGTAGVVAGAAGSATGGVGGSGGVAGEGSSGGNGGGGVGGGPPALPTKSGVLCVFDYDLTLSTNACQTEQYDCRTNTCLTYNWYQQCMSKGARHAIETCVQRGAYIGIASHANVDLCWADKVSVVISQMQFPALTNAQRYGNALTDFAYPKLDQRDNWNCDTCAYHMNGAFSKPQLIAKVMAHYGMDSKKAADRAKVIFWDDLPDNIAKMKAEMPEVHTIHVHQNIDGEPNSGGCGILDSDVTAGWAAFPE